MFDAWFSIAPSALVWMCVLANVDCKCTLTPYLTLDLRMYWSWNSTAESHIIFLSAVHSVSLRLIFCSWQLWNSWRKIEQYSILLSDNKRSPPRNALSQTVCWMMACNSFRVVFSSHSTRISLNCHCFWEFVWIASPSFYISLSLPLFLFDSSSFRLVCTFND